jgi:hypothetical protein
MRPERFMVEILNGAMHPPTFLFIDWHIGGVVTNSVVFLYSTMFYRFVYLCDLMQRSIVSLSCSSQSITRMIVSRNTGTGTDTSYCINAFTKIWHFNRSIDITLVSPPPPLLSTFSTSIIVTDLITEVEKTYSSGMIS